MLYFFHLCVFLEQFSIVRCSFSLDFQRTGERIHLRFFLYLACFSLTVHDNGLKLFHSHLTFKGGVSRLSRMLIRVFSS